MALFFGVNIGLVEGSPNASQPGKAKKAQPSRLIRWLFRRKQARFG